MIENRLKKCCDDCADIVVCTKTDRVRTSRTNVCARVQIYCEHEKVCGEYIKESEESEHEKENKA